MCGGLARWLRAAGYDAFWKEGINDWDLVRRALREDEILLTSDGGICRIGIVRDGELPALFIPPGMSKAEQLQFVLKSLGLALREPRCMACGGELAEVPKQRVRGRVPPRSFEQHESFYECERCRKLFWKGTHWPKIRARLEESKASFRDPHPVTARIAKRCIENPIEGVDPGEEAQP
jgi:uncharacterized protein with PIN domain